MRNRRNAPSNAVPMQDMPDGEWHQYGRTTHATRYARLDQITPDNVDKLKVLWHKRTNRPNMFKATPIQVGDLLYICTAFNFVQALDAETGDQILRLLLRLRDQRRMTVLPDGRITLRLGGLFSAEAIELKTEIEKIREQIQNIE